MGFGGGTWYAGREDAAPVETAAPQPTAGEKREYIGEGPDFLGRRPSDTSGLAGQELARTPFYWSTSRLQYEVFDGTLPPQLCTIISMENDTDQMHPISSSDFIAYSPDGQEVETGIGIVGDFDSLITHDSEPGEDVDLSLCFLSGEDPEPGQWLVAYIGNMYGGERLVWINNL